MTVAATSAEAKVLEVLEDMLAASAAFRTWTGATDVAAAHGHVFYQAVPESSITAPAAVIGLVSAPQRAIAGGVSTVYGEGAAAFVVFVGEVPVAHQDDDKEAVMWWLNTVGGVIEEVLEQSETGGKLMIRRAVLEEFDRVPLTGPEKAALGDEMQAVYRLETGL